MEKNMRCAVNKRPHLCKWDSFYTEQYNKYDWIGCLHLNIQADALQPPRVLYRIGNSFFSVHENRAVPFGRIHESVIDPSLNLELSECQREVLFACLSVGFSFKVSEPPTHMQP